MIQVLTFSILAATLVYIAGRKDAARDPRLTGLLLVLLGIFPLLSAIMPEIAMLPSRDARAGGHHESWLKYLPIIWAIGFTMATTRLLVAAVVLHRWRKQSVEVDQIDGVAVCQLRDLQGPVAAGVINPIIFVPASWQAWPDKNKRIVLEHELAHHARWDPLWRLLAELVCAVHWYHPFAHWMKRRFIIQCEYACDARVLGKGIDPKAYASVLCDFASNGSPSPLAPAMAETCSLESRVIRMMNPCGKFSTRSFVLFGLIGLGTACLLSMIARESDESLEIPPSEIELRWTSNPFPAEPV